MIRCSCVILQWPSTCSALSGNTRVAGRRAGEARREKEKSLYFFADFFFQFLKLVPQAWRAPAGGIGGTTSESLAFLQLGPRIQTWYLSLPRQRLAWQHFGGFPDQA